MKNQILFKSINQKDKNYLWKSYQKAMKSHIENIWGWNLTWQKNDFNKNLSHYKNYILCLSDNRIGYVQYKIENNECYINMLILEPEYQSKGLGSEILATILARKSISSIKLRCFKVNIKAYRFYINQGFDVIDEDDDFYLLYLPKH